MARGVARKHDRTSGFLCWRPVRIIEGSPDTFVNNRSVARRLDKAGSHRCYKKTFQSHIVTSSGSYFVNGRGVARRLDRLSIFPGMHFIVEASSDTFTS